MRRLVSFAQYNNLTLPEMLPLLTKTWQVETFDPCVTYDRNNVTFVCNQYQYEKNQSIIDALIDQDYKLVVDNLLEAAPCFNPSMRDRANVMQMICVDADQHVDPDFISYNIHPVPMFIWVHDSRVFANTAGDNKEVYRKRRFQPGKKALTLMRNQRSHRDYIFDHYQDILSMGLYSYLDRGVGLPEVYSTSDIGWDRSVNVEWFNQTAFTLAVETVMSPGPGKVFVTEKTFKPLQAMHPFLVAGCKGTLALLKQQGFETFDNWFDESYDNIEDEIERIQRVMQMIKDFQFNGYDQLTLSKMQHNRNLFYDLSMTEKYYDRHVSQPMLEFSETQQGQRH